ncbi:Metallo-hydrolase/oxidoreductase [Aspergillus sclerotioniger CBS 115572]|uniref:Metallo-hydrolase/oxidoreductase n=1 Tax=Aspergillus sclerotioniger CBS 115572 TaxID=1450535 RepID=A0A317XCS8_9EURO|nr:Metallo-hydrolase/oxidoreductase [Aspergillus sclerotioniger CBS 115572]PWY94350.1 Metallo-hydrolase/oxidoreductase [Aspergillus sclerotioniger CBS 115572]
MASQQMEPDLFDRTDFANASRGLIGSLQPGIIRAADGRTVYNDAYDFLQASECPATANPKLWRQGQLASMQRLFEVTPGIYQVRGLDLANMTVVEGAEEVIIIDPNIRGMRCCRLDSSVSIPLIVPEGFVEEAMSENIYVGPAMHRRALYIYGYQLPKSPNGQIGCGIGMTVSRGTTSFVPPNTIVSSTGERTIDGVRIQFQLVPETEAPAEMKFFFPDHRALYIAECATHSLHKIITLRGALVRDSKAWARYLDESLVLYGQESDVLFAGHNWPTWGQSEIERLIYEHHNVKGIYQRYMGWFDGNPAHLWEYPPVENAKRYVACMGGIDEVAARPRDSRKMGIYDLLPPSWDTRSPLIQNMRSRRDAGRGVGAVRVRGGERHMAQLLPVGGAEFARGAPN